MRRATISLLFAVFTLCTQGAAQTAQKFSIQASALGVQLTGVADEELAFGGGGEIQVRFTPSLFSIGVGVQTTQHSLGANTITFKGGFIEPRYVFLTVRDAVALYASARFMTLDRTADLFIGQFITKGSALSGGGGLLIRLGSRLNGDLGVTAGKEYYSGNRTEGLTVVTRLGLALGIG